MKEYELYIHSRCCGGHWELVYGDGKYDLICEKCGKPSGFGLIAPVVGKPECEQCKSDKPIPDSQEEVSGENQDD